MKKEYSTIIWDFNGTLLDDVLTGIVSVNKLLADRGLPTIPDVEHYRSVFRFPVIDYYRSIGFDFSKEPYEVIAPQWVELYLENVKRAGLFDDVIETLERLRKRGKKMIVLSATERGMLMGQLEGLGILDYFDEVLGLDNIHAGSKVEIAKRWREKDPNASALLVGDTDHDAQTAKAMGVDCALVCRGHQPRRYLEELGADVYDDLGFLQ